MSLADVLYNTNTGDIFVPNTGATVKSDEVENKSEEIEK